MTERLNEKLQILRKLRILRELRKIAIFVKFVAEQKIVKIVVVFYPGHECEPPTSSLKDQSVTEQAT